MASAIAVSDYLHELMYLKLRHIVLFVKHLSGMQPYHS